MAETPLVRAAGLGKSFRGRRSTTQAIADIGFEQAPGEFLGVVGPSGCGKTTLLRCLAGLERPDTGTVEFDGRPVTGIPDAVSVVFQDYHRSLFPWLTAGENVRFPIRDRGRAAGREQAREALDRVGLAGFADHHPFQLSGGMQQRVAIARAIVSRPRFLLMDEPFASVDAQTRAVLEQLTVTITAELGLTVLLITHDIDEAILMADRVLVLSARPSRVLREVPIDLDRPRDEVETRALPLFQDYRREIHRVIANPGTAD
ncbi:ABC transporter [Actinoplanes cyaneus]|uniref:ABC transporter n=1 Tax=Actinoplanes cyaneus TaxID=52696 RepID=A0A919LXZ3_9ACTN|nr:ABC transporter ATP-binding protein [Actinoplanes cyaneus]MCW2136194.1 NitT/TauT family transport system ATP-binding protein [Actinoplanes cyaneus]GID62435.1 ABC transporter [Actinoplanes cyaneus]